MTDVSAIVCAFGPEPHLPDVVAALRASSGVDVEIIVVDNGSPACADLPADVTVLRPGRNTGFAGGCNLGAGAATAATLVFVNSDAIVDRDCLRLLHADVSDPGAGLVGATILLADEPEVVNSWGNPVHLLGFSWAGGYGHPAAQARSGERASVSGAVFAVRADVYRELGGMDEDYFAYGEDLELSMRAHLAGYGVEVDADAVAWHHYDFARNPDKLYLLERNRLITVLTTYSGRTLLAVMPLLVAAEAAVLLRARREGWSDRKRQGWRWLAGHRRYLRDRRRRVQGLRRRDDRVLDLRVALDPPERFGIAMPPRWQGLVDTYWTVVGSRVAGL